MQEPLSLLCPAHDVALAVMNIAVASISVLICAYLSLCATAYLDGDEIHLLIQELLYGVVDLAPCV